MADKLFGTDGIRGRVNTGAIRPDMFLRFGEAFGSVLRKSHDAPTVLIARDTRASGEMIQSAIEAGLFNAGVSVARAGVLPTPAVGCLVRSEGYASGLMITASHNPAPDNGVKVFGRDGFKLTQDMQDEIETLIQDTSSPCFVDVGSMGRGIEASELRSTYIRFAKDSILGETPLKGMRLCIDAANGAGFDVALDIFEQLGAEVVLIGASPDGANINEKCGALHLEKLTARTIADGADLGIAFDGDADRIALVDETGQEIDGDQIMGAIALHYKAQGKLAGDTLVATIMSNLGLEQAMKRAGITLERTKVGDRYVVECMRENGFVVGGEQSGHVVLADYVTTGDAIIAALQVLSIMVSQNKRASEVLKVFEPVPQVLKNVRYETSDPLSSDLVKEAYSRMESELAEAGRIVLRKSGTEPLIRVMAEAQSAELAERVVDTIIDAVQKADAL